jgi:ATP phosphoribosyltransferase
MAANGPVRRGTLGLPARGRLDAEVLRFGVPQRGRIGEQALPFLESCGLRVRKESERQLTAGIDGLPGVTVILQRAEDILRQVADGKADIGITGMDIVHEVLGERGDVVVLHDNLGFSASELVVAVPDSWIDVSTVADLADVAIEMRERGDELRVATSFPNLARRFFYAHGITHFSFVQLTGGVEAAPGVGFADVVVDVTSTGTTLKENRLKVLRNGTVFQSHACLVGNRRALAEHREKRELTRRILELIEARLRAQEYFSITANLQGASERDVARALLQSPATHGRRGPTVARVYTEEDLARAGSGEPGWFAATIIVGAADLQAAVDHLRAVGGSGISVVPLRYLFNQRSERYEALLAELGLRPAPTPPAGEGKGPAEATSAAERLPSP